MVTLSALVVAFVAGLYYRRAAYEMARAYRMWRMGICFSFQDPGVRETRNGTSSHFCLRCGHPHGYHVRGG
jgi:hypothetical protein